MLPLQERRPTNGRQDWSLHFFDYIINVNVTRPVGRRRIDALLPCLAPWKRGGPARTRTRNKKLQRKRTLRCITISSISRQHPPSAGADVVYGFLGLHPAMIYSKLLNLYCLFSRCVDNCFTTLALTSRQFNGCTPLLSKVHFSAQVPLHRS